MTAGLVDYLAEVPIFEGLDQKELQSVADIAIVRPYKKGMVIFVEGEPGDGVYLVKSGLVKIAKTLADGREKTLHYLREGDIFAEVLLFDGGSFPATAEALEDAEIAILRRERIEDLLIENGRITLKILKVMSRRLRQAQVQVRDLAYADVYARVAFNLLQLAKDHGLQGNEGLIIDLPLSQQELANLVGTSRETVARIISEWKRKGIIAVSQQKITILKPDRLQGWLG
ncbi:MAG: Crp/Fnr family transcriptional regulator [Bacillota bacterium]